MTKEIQAKVDAWYKEYCKKNGKAPTWGELVEATKKIEKGG